MAASGRTDAARDGGADRHRSDDHLQVRTRKAARPALASPRQDSARIEDRPTRGVHVWTTAAHPSLMTPESSHAATDVWTKRPTSRPHLPDDATLITGSNRRLDEAAHPSLMTPESSQVEVDVGGRTGSATEWVLTVDGDDGRLSRAAVGSGPAFRVSWAGTRKRSNPWRQGTPAK